MMNDKSFYDILKERVLVLDGAMGTMIQNYKLSENDFRGSGYPWIRDDIRYAGCNDLLSLTRPDVIYSIHERYLQSGADIISTDTFNANAISLADYELHHDNSLIRELNRAAAALARAAADNASPRSWGGRALVAGSIGPTNKSATMSPDVTDPASRNVSYDQLFNAYIDQIRGLIDGGVDLLLFETVFDTLNLKAGLDAANTVMAETGKRLPIMVSATISDRSGRTLSGQTLKAFVASVEEYDNVASLGLNCSFGPKDIIPAIQSLGLLTSHFISTHPNAGLPDALGEYNVSPENFAEELRPLIDGKSVNIIGGCCGTTPRHIDALHRLVANASPRIPVNPEKILRLSGLECLEVRKENNFLVVGERCNVAGSRKFLRLIKEKKYDEAIRIAISQVESGASVIDINMDDPLLDAPAEMTHFLRLYASEPEVAKVPVMVDSSDWNVIEAALKNLQGKSIVNSISLREGEEVFIKKAKRIRQLGAALIVMAFDEKGQADTYERKIEVCRRAYHLLTEKCGFPAEDIIFDVNVMAVATGLEQHLHYGLDFIKAVKWIKENLPGVRTSGGVSNLSFAFRGKNAIRESMHTVFLYHAINAGLDMAIMNPATAITYEEIDPRLRDIIEDVILARRRDASDQLSAYASEDLTEKNSHDVSARDLDTPVEERLVAAIVAGRPDFIAADLDILSDSMKAVNIVEGPLMEGMRKVGTLFGEGRMFLPQVVKSARVMKLAVDHLEPLLRGASSDSSDKKAGKVLIATVKGDVHDIGKNIVSIVLSCNNFDVIDLGVMVDAETIVDTAVKENPDIICLSGLITPSLAEMTATAKALKAAGLKTPLMVGGATTSALHTALKIAPVYDGPVVHVKDASQNPLLAAALLNPEECKDFTKKLKSRQQLLRQEYESENPGFVPLEEARKSGKMSASTHMPKVNPRCGTGNLIVKNFTIEELEPWINWKMLMHAWGMHTAGCDCCDKDVHSGQLISDARKCLSEIAASGEYDGFGLVRITDACSDGDNIHVGGICLPLLRQQRRSSSFTCLADYVNPEGDFVGVFLAGAGDFIDREHKRLLKAGDNYKALLLQSISDRLAEASSEYLHFLVRTQYWGYSPDEKLDIGKILRGEYVGIRPAMGYPMLPDQLLNKDLMTLLEPESGKHVIITENGAMAPSSTVSGLYIANPEARYFQIGKISSDQISDYARRRDLTETQVMNILKL